MVKKWTVVLAVVALVLSQATAYACTSFQVKSEDGTVVIGRSNEFGIDAKSQIVYEPAGKTFASTSPAGGQGKGWTSKYAFLGINGLGMPTSFGDGMNEAGLSMEGLYFTESKYEAADASQAESTLSSNDFVTWVLGNFATVDEVKTALSSVRVWGELVPALGTPIPLHFAIHDASGKCIVLGFIDGVRKIYDIPIDALKDMPDFPL